MLKKSKSPAAAAAEPERLCALQEAIITATEVAFHVIGQRKRPAWFGPAMEDRLESALQVLLPVCAAWRDTPPARENTVCASAAEKMPAASPEGERTTASTDPRQLAIPGA